MKGRRGWGKTAWTDREGREEVRPGGHRLAVRGEEKRRGRADVDWLGGKKKVNGGTNMWREIERD